MTTSPSPPTAAGSQNTTGHRESNGREQSGTAADNSAGSQEFNLLDESWIPVLGIDGSLSEVGIREILANAGNYQRLACDVPTMDVAIFRLILAILYRAWDSPEWQRQDPAVEHWEDKWGQETLLDGAVEDYLRQWQHRFDLRGSEHPFFQVASLRTAKDSWHSLAIVLPETALFTMRTGQSAFSPAEAARLLVTCMGYDYSGIKSGAVGDPRVKGGRGYPIGVGWLGWMGATVIEGHNLKESLLLNYVPFRSEAGTQDLPQWEVENLGAAPRPLRETDDKHPEANGTTGQVELLTWPQRRILLHWNGDCADGILVCNGDPVGYTTKDLVETMTPWRYSKPQSTKAKAARYMPMQLERGRAMWRSLGGLLPFDHPQEVKTPYGQQAVQKPATTISWVQDLIGDVLPADFEFQVRMVSMEYGSQNSSYSDVVADAMHIPGALFSKFGEDYRRRARDAVTVTDQVAYFLGRFHKDLHFAVSGETDVDPSETRLAFYSAIDAPFRRWLRAMPDEDLDAHVTTWIETAISLATTLARQLLEAQGPAAWTGRWNEKSRRPINGATAESLLRRGLNALRREGGPIDLSSKNTNTQEAQ
ncbi:type I-E CRISPR-associated protein Cse1/CasA [Corynebacterium heidelbergense]|uniref:Type I-E CRISPR-associated protein Cse1/CasA n=1 Tax=Corynebacterium heidelbergense TaxID=2055947 RepID=A0A364V504_9CORY|nr:type I-E CRISPR-associated protein Cse1/CasA [Corynebacterium heidelbergense]RAV31701.1 type I-E CRISPR-associated protein Cse1/CasA [Corynebacterium heidelbergense]